MARRTDGTARRYEFQIFDNPQGRAIAQTLDGVQAAGGSAADFIRAALTFYIEHQAAPPEPTLPAPKLQQEINALWKALAQTARNVPAADESPSAVTSSSGLDMSARRRGTPAPRLDAGAPPPPAREFDAEASSRLLVKTIREFSSNLQRGR